jgi:hypothetical protein
MNIGNAFPGSYLKASDLQGRNITISIHSVSMEEVGGDIKPILFFADANGAKKDRGLVLNKTNSNIIAEMYGWETDEWGGKPIVLYPARVEFSGRIVDAIRVKLESGTAVPAAPAPKVKQAPIAHRNGHTAPPAVTQAAPMPVDDEIPF